MQIGIPCIGNSFPYARMLVWSISKTIKTKDIELIFTAPKEQISNYLKLYDEFGILCRVIGIPNKKACNRSHGEALDILLDYMTHDICGFMDCDIAMLMKSWDSILRSHLRGDIAIIGTPYWQPNKYRNFPNVIFCMFKRQILKNCDISLVPASFYKVEPELSEIYDRPVDYKILLDTGYQLPLKLKSNGYTGKCFEVLRSYDRKAVVKAKKHKKTGEEYHINGAPICTHFRRSAEFKFGDRLVSEWRKNIGRYLKRLRIA